MVVPGEGSEWTARQDERAKATPLGQRCLAMDVQRLPVLVVSVAVWCVCGLWGVSELRMGRAQEERRRSEKIASKASPSRGNELSLRLLHYCYSSSLSQPPLLHPNVLLTAHVHSMSPKRYYCINQKIYMITHRASPSAPPLRATPRHGHGCCCCCCCCCCCYNEHGPAEQRLGWVPAVDAAALAGVCGGPICDRPGPASASRRISQASGMCAWVG